MKNNNIENRLKKLRDAAGINKESTTLLIYSEGETRPHLGYKLCGVNNRPLTPDELENYREGEDE